jgi:hypothetical protein
MHNAILHFLFELFHALEQDCEIRVSKLTQQVSTFLANAGEQAGLTPRKTGAIVTAMGFCRGTRSALDPAGCRKGSPTRCLYTVLTNSTVSESKVLGKV